MLQQKEKEIYDLAGEQFNINSPKQLSVILFEKLELPVIKKTKSGFSTDVSVLEELSSEHDLPEAILIYRQMGKLKSTYVDALQGLINKESGRIHSSFNQTITATGRLSSSNPNLQNIPIRKEEGRRIRQAFIPKEGCILISADYSQIELRILAHCAEDEILIDAFNSGEDIHARTAVEVFQVVPELLTDDLRSQAKAVNFGIVYGMSAYRLANELSISRKMAKSYIDNYFKRYAGVRRFIDAIIEETRKSSEVSTIFGRKRRIDDINAANATVRGYAERAAINTPIQGSSADLIKLAMIKLSEELENQNMEAKILLSVHDEIILECPLDEKENLIELTRDVMENIYPLKVPLKVNFGSGQNWAEAH